MYDLKVQYNNPCTGQKSEAARAQGERVGLLWALSVLGDFLLILSKMIYDFPVTVKKLECMDRGSTIISTL